MRGVEKSAIKRCQPIGIKARSPISDPKCFTKYLAFSALLYQSSAV
jgi:hypothetical protein